MIKIEEPLKISQKNEVMARPKYNNKNSLKEYQIIDISESQNLNSEDEYYFINKPKKVHFIPKNKGLNKFTQIPRFDWELHDFNMEVKPILEVLVGKTLEISRMELIEEFERKEKLKKRNRFEIIRNGELMTTQRLDNEHKRLEEEKRRREKQRNIYYENLKENHKKLFSRRYSVNYLLNMKNNVFEKLTNKGILNNPKLFEINNRVIENLFVDSEKIINKKIKTENFLNHLINDINNLFWNQHKKVIDNDNMKKQIKQNKINLIKLNKIRVREKKLKNLKLKEEYEKKLEIKDEYEKNILNKDIREINSANELNINSILLMTNEPSTHLIGGLLGELWLILDCYDNYFVTISNFDILKFLFRFFKENNNIILNIDLQNYLLEDIKEIFPDRSENLYYENFNILWDRLKFNDFFLNYIKENNLISNDSLKKLFRILLKNLIVDIENQPIIKENTMNSIKDINKDKEKEKEKEEEEKKEEFYLKKLNEKIIFNYKEKEESVVNEESERKETEEKEPISSNRNLTNKSVNLTNNTNKILSNKSNINKFEEINIDIKNIECVMRIQNNLNKNNELDFETEEFEEEIERLYNLEENKTKFKRIYLFKEYYINKKIKQKKLVDEKLYSNYYNFDGSLYSKELEEFGELISKNKPSYYEYKQNNHNVILLNRVNQKYLRNSIINNIEYNEEKNLEEFKNNLEEKYLNLEANILQYIKEENEENEEIPIFDYELN